MQERERERRELNYLFDIYMEGEDVDDDDELELVNKLFQLDKDVAWEWIGLMVKGDFKTLSYCWW